MNLKGWNIEAFCSAMPAVAVAASPANAPGGKAAWRAAAEAMLRARSPAARKQHAQMLARWVVQAAQASGAERVGLYSPIGAETETRELANALLVSGLALCYPRLRPDGSSMDFAEATGPAALQPRPRSRLLEPTGPVVAADALDILVIPCLALTPQLIRLGHGGGYFDRYLPSVRADCLRVGVASAQCVWDWAPVQDHDQRLHCALVEGGVFGPAS